MGSGLTVKGLSNNIKSISRKQGQLQQGSDKSNYGRVLDVVLDSSHPMWNKLGQSQCLYGVFYQQVAVDDSTELVPEKNFAYCKQSTFRRIPVKNEIVTLSSALAADKTEEIGKITSERIYWDEIVPLWNHPHLNTYPDTIAFGDGPADTGNSFKEKDGINPLQLLSGDVSIEGRFGNTIRLGGTGNSNSPVAEKDGQPYIIIRAGQGVESSAGYETVYEDINKDSSSIYLMSEHKVALKDASTKRNAYKSGDAPESFSSYTGAQILINSDRVGINAKNKDIELVSKEGTGISAKKVSIDGKDYVAFDADSIFLGTNSTSKQQPILLGQKTVDWLDDLCNQLITLLTTMSTTTTPAQLAGLASQAASVLSSITPLKSRLTTLKSKKSFVE